MLSRFIQSYVSLGVSIWGVTAQNEPNDGRFPSFDFNCMGWTAAEQRDFVAGHLGPTLEAAGLGDVKIMIFDDQRPLAPLWVPQVTKWHPNLKVALMSTTLLKK